MTFSQEKRVTVKSEWLIDFPSIAKNGSLQSPHFGSASTFFYWQAENVNNSAYSIHLYLAECPEERISVKGRVLFSPVLPFISTLPLNGQVSLDKRAKLSLNNWSGRAVNISTELTFTERETSQLNQLRHYQSLSRQFQSLRQHSAKSADITLFTTVDERHFPAHKLILSARSSVFAAMFDNEDFTENENRQVVIDDLSGDAIDALLDYLYCGDVGKIDKIAESLLPAADKYDIPLLVQACTQSMIASLSIENAARFFYLFDLHNLVDAKKNTLKFIISNCKEIRKSTGWKQYLKKEHLEQLIDFM